MLWAMGILIHRQNLYAFHSCGPPVTVKHRIVKRSSKNLLVYKYVEIFFDVHDVRHVHVMILSCILVMRQQLYKYVEIFFDVHDVHHVHVMILSCILVMRQQHILSFLSVYF
jgi:hypothetical protein